MKRPDSPVKEFMYRFAAAQLAEEEAPEDADRYTKVGP